MARCTPSSSWVTYTLVTCVLIVVPLMYDRLHVPSGLGRKACKLPAVSLRPNATALKNLNTPAAMREHFIATVSHELRTPMNAILGFNALLLARVARQTRSPQGAQPHAPIRRPPHDGDQRHLGLFATSVGASWSSSPRPLNCGTSPSMPLNCSSRVWNSMNLDYRLECWTNRFARLGAHRPPPPDAGVGQFVGQCAQIHAPRLGGFAACSWTDPGVESLLGAGHRALALPRSGKLNRSSNALAQAENDTQTLLRGQWSGAGHFSETGPICSVACHWF